MPYENFFIYICFNLRIHCFNFVHDRPLVGMIEDLKQDNTYGFEGLKGPQIGLQTIMVFLIYFDTFFMKVCTWWY